MNKYQKVMSTSEVKDGDIIYLNITGGNNEHMVIWYIMGVIYNETQFKTVFHGMSLARNGQYPKLDSFVCGSVYEKEAKMTRTGTYYRKGDISINCHCDFEAYFDSRIRDNSLFKEKAS